MNIRAGSDDVTLDSPTSVESPQVACEKFMAQSGHGMSKETGLLLRARLRRPRRSCYWALWRSSCWGCSWHRPSKRPQRCSGRT